MKTFKIILTSLIVSMLLSINVSAASLPQGQYGMAQATDMEMLFGAQGQGLQLAVLSQEEMEATEGAFWPWVANRLGGGLAGAYGAGHGYVAGARGKSTNRGLASALATGFASGAVSPARGYRAAARAYGAGAASGFVGGSGQRRGWW